MKKITYLMILGIFIFNISQSQIKLISNGYVKIGSSANPTKTLDVAGKVLISPAVYGNLVIDNTGYYNTVGIHPTTNACGSLGNSGVAFQQIWYYENHNLSDSRQKENIRSINNALHLIMQLKGIEYDIKKEYTIQKDIKLNSKDVEKAERDRKDKFGFIAQDVQKILPQVVYYDDSTDIYSMDYIKIIPVLIEAMKQQQIQIDSLKQSIKKNISNLKSAELESEVKELSEQEDVPTLEQNFPNPFSSATTINIFVPQSNGTAVIYIYDMQGSQKRAYNITSKGKSSININGYELQAGMYMYTLIVDGKEVDTKKMILTE